jgi:HEAT repeat protein
MQAPNLRHIFIMKNLLTFSVTFRSVQGVGLPRAAFRLLAVLALGLAAITVPLLVAQAQKSEGLTVKTVSSRASSTGIVVSIAADGSMSRAQTWQDSEGYHVVLPNTVSVDSLKTGRGVKVRKVGDSLEILLQTRPGTPVSVEGGRNQLNFVIDGKLDPRPTDSELRARVAAARDERVSDEAKLLSPSSDETVSPIASSNSDTSPSSGLSESGNGQAPTQAGKAESGPPLIGPNQLTTPNTPSVSSPAASDIQVQDEDGGLLASVFSGTSVLIVISLGLFGLLVSRKIRSKQDVAQDGSELPGARDGLADSELVEGKKDLAGAAPKSQQNMSLARAGGSAPTRGFSTQSVARLPVAGPTSLYGAYRIDQEVGKLLLGQPHRIDVLASRAIDDRRAIETSLIKGVNSPNLEERAQIRAREALEEYGFVARQCATLLLAPDAFERTSAARALGEIKSAAALPFLLEGLYDSESIVRNQAVVSIGELKLPSAIGALLDIARTHPDVSSALLSRTLSACSVEGLDFFDAIAPEQALIGSGLGKVVDEITHLEPAMSVESLPESDDDPQLVHALSLIDSLDVQMRAEALKTLVQFRVQSAVEAIARVARHDSETNIRSMAISSLGTINHESVFPTVLIGMADESLEVRASAARTLSRLSVDRADAYVRVLETCDEETVRNVAKACIKAGIVSQNLDRLANSDHRQAYEAFSLICLLSKANMNEPVLSAISVHPNIDVRLKVVHLLSCTGHPATVSQLRDLAVTDGMGEEVKTALLEAIYKLEQAKPTEAVSPASQDFNSLQEFEAFNTIEAYFEPKLESKCDEDYQDPVELEL